MIEVANLANIVGTMLLNQIYKRREFRGIIFNPDVHHEQRHYIRNHPFVALLQILDEVVGIYTFKKWHSEQFAF